MAIPPRNPTTIASFAATPQQMEERERARQRQAMGSRLESDRKAFADSWRQAGRTMHQSTIGLLSNINFSNELPRQAIRDQRQADARRQWERDNPQQARQQRQAAGQFYSGIADRSLDRAMKSTAHPWGVGETVRSLPGSVGRSPSAPRVPGQQDIAAGVPAQASVGQSNQEPAANPLASLPQGENLASELTGRARANAPVTSLQNRIVRDGNSFSANTPIGPGATIGSTDTLQIGQRDDGRPMRDINTYDSADVIEQGLLASQIRDLGRMERSNPNPMAVIRDETRGGFQGDYNRRMNERDAEARQLRSQEHQQGIEQRRQGILDGLNAGRDRQAASEERAYQRQQDALAERRAQLGDQLAVQQIAQGRISLAQQGQLEDLRRRIADPSLSLEEREAAERAYQAMSTLGRDRYVQQDVIMGHNPDTGVPIIGRVAFDTTTGQQLGGQELQAQERERAAHQDAQDAMLRGATREEANRRLINAGFNPLGSQGAAQPQQASRRPEGGGNKSLTHSSVLRAYPFINQMVGNEYFQSWIASSPERMKAMSSGSPEAVISVIDDYMEHLQVD